MRPIHDVLLGDRSLFTRPDGLAAAWQAAEPLLTSPPAVRGYAPGSWGPPEAGELIAPGQWLLGQRPPSHGTGRPAEPPGPLSLLTGLPRQPTPALRVYSRRSGGTQTVTELGRP